MKNILIIGYSSFVGRGLEHVLLSKGFNVDCFKRELFEKRENNFVLGDISNFKTNTNFKNKYDIIINFVILKDKGVNENIEYISTLIEFCKQKQVSQLIHFSSIMVYANNEKEINEATAIETVTQKRGYGEVKIEVDKYLLSLKDLAFKVSLVRPGYVLADDRPCPFVKKLPLGISIIKGNRKSVQPIIKRTDIHIALLNMIQLGSVEQVYLFTPSQKTTKYDYAKQNFGGIVLSLPKWIVLGASRLLLKLKLIAPSLFVRVEGMYIESVYDSSYTEKVLNIKF